MLREPVIDILMYHSVSEAGGPTSIPPAIFRDQLQAIADAGIPVRTLDDLLAHRDGTRRLPEQAIIITFDDAFQDFADAAWPALKAHGFPAIVYVPSDFVGRAEGWNGANVPARALMSWDTMRALQAEGASFGSHSVTHSDLTSVTGETLDVELSVSKGEIEDALGTVVRHFAPPYGRMDRTVCAHAGRVYETTVSTRLARATAADNLMDLPRLEMFYFTDLRRWRDHLAGRGDAYLRRRRALRWVRQTLLRR